MNSDYYGNRAARRAGPLAAAMATAVLAAATACSGATASTGSAQGSATDASASAGAAGQASLSFSQALKLAQCMRAHGAADFPEPERSGNYAVFSGTFRYGRPPWQQAQRACKALAPAGFFPATG
jgi:hypothetical protein